MFTLKNYVRAQSLGEAYELCQKKSNVVLGGMLWLKMQKKNINTAIDLSDLGLDVIEETEKEYRIGAMVTLRALELHKGLNDMTQGAVRDSVRQIVGVQFRNTATVGGSIYGRFGFSDVLTLFLALGAKVELYHAGMMSLEEFTEYPRENRDILVRLIVPKIKQKAVYLSQRNTATDFPVLTCAVSECQGAYRCVIGARPMKAIVFGDESKILTGGITEESAEAYAEEIATRVSVGSNMRAGDEYRWKICRVLVRRALLGLCQEGE